MRLLDLKLRNFRNHESASVRLGRGLTIITGPNGAGKTNILEASQYVLCGRSFRTSRDNEMVNTGAEFLRLEAEIEMEGSTFRRSVGIANGSPAVIDPGGGPQWLDPGAVLCFSPDDLQLIKGAPAGRRRFLDESIARRRPAHGRLTAEYQRIMSQRNSFLGRARAGLVPLGDIKPWDRQLALAVLAVHAARRDYSRLIAPHFEEAWRQVAGPGEVEIDYRSQLELAAPATDPEEAVLKMLRDGWAADMERATTGTGTHRDEIRFILDGKPLRELGSQGEQRAAVLALFMAARNLAGEEGAPLPLLLLDDVMSELDPGRRRRLMESLVGEGQAVVTAADAGLFSAGELAAAAVIEVEAGAVVAEAGGV